MGTLMVSTEGKYRCVYDADIVQRYQWTPGGLNEANFGKHMLSAAKKLQPPLTAAGQQTTTCTDGQLRQRAKKSFVVCRQMRTSCQALLVQEEYKHETGAKVLPTRRNYVLVKHLTPYCQHCWSVES